MRPLLFALVFCATTACSADDRVDVSRVAIGQCFANDMMASDDLVHELTRVDCAQPHRAELFLLQDLPRGSYPGDDAVETMADRLCEQEFMDYTGVAYDESDLVYTHLTPTAESWREWKDREVQCFIVDPDGRTLRGSARDPLGK